MPLSPREALQSTVTELANRTPGSIKSLLPVDLKARIVNGLWPEPETVEPCTVFVSYPKSGRTWLRVLLGKAIAERYGFDDKDALGAHRLAGKFGLDALRWTHDGSAPLDGTCYWEQCRDKSAFQDKKVVFLTRDIRDVLVSSYHASRKRDRVFEGDISSFIRSDTFGVKRILTFHNTWHRNRDVPARFLHFRYEDLHREPMPILREILTLIGSDDIDDSILEKAVKFGAFENMRRLEESRFFKSGVMRPRIDGDPDSRKVRVGRVGGYRDELSAEDLAYIAAVERELGNPFPSGV